MKTPAAALVPALTLDYLKSDWCNTEGLAARGVYLTMRQALAAAGRPVVFSICEWGDNRPSELSRRPVPKWPLNWP